MSSRYAVESTSTPASTGQKRNADDETDDIPANNDDDANRAAANVQSHNKPCSCMWMSCKRLGGHRIPPPTEGHQWLSRLSGLHVLSTELKEAKQALADGSALRIHSEHFYPTDLTSDGSGRTILGPSFDHNNPRFRSQRDIDEGKTAPSYEKVSSLDSTSSSSTSVSRLSAEERMKISDDMTSERKKQRVERELELAADLYDKMSLKQKVVHLEGEFAESKLRLKEALKLLRKKEEEYEAARSADVAASEAKDREMELLRHKLNTTRGKKSSLGWDAFMTDTKLPMKSYTGFDSKEALAAFYDLLNADGACERLNTWGLKKKTKQGRKSHHTKMDPKDALVLALFVLRTGVDLKVASHLFGISPAATTRYFTTWITFLNRFFETEFPYPTVAQLQNTTKDQGMFEFEWDAL